MGSDKALLPYSGTTLIEYVARAVQEAAGAVAIIGDPQRYGGFGYRVIADQIPGCGPLGGLHTALSISDTDWNVVAACDMPGISTEILFKLLDQASRTAAECVAAALEGSDPEPLCAVYHRKCLPAVTRALRDKRLKLKDLLQDLEVESVPADAVRIANVNTPAEWISWKLHTP